MTRYTASNTTLLSRLLIDQGLPPPSVADWWSEPAGEESVSSGRPEIAAGTAEPSIVGTDKLDAT